MSFFRRALLLFHTVRHLRLTQIYHQAYYRIRPPAKVPYAPSPPIRGAGDIVQFIPGSGAVRETEWQFTFLNRCEKFPRNEIDWRAPSASKLWRYNLQYFDYLQDPALDDASKSALIESWIASNPPGIKDAWEPYPVSLRTVNFIKYFASGSAGPVPDLWLTSLAQQVRYLEQRLEYHLLANHLLKNAVAFLFAGVWFGGDDGARWFQKGSELLRKELAEQFLADGGHFERSPMYHAICLVDCLDVLNMLSGRSEPGTEALCQTLVDVIEPALAFLRDTTLPDGRLSLFNDAAHGIAPAPVVIADYAARILGRTVEFDEAPGFRWVYRPQTGYFGYRKGGEGLLIDCGPIGPSYQPGHAHCDTLSFEWVVDWDRVVVDTGTFDYEPGPRRQYARGTRGHNTVTVDDAEQSEIWGVFRVARRARARLMRCDATDGRFEFEGGHDGYCRLKGKPYVTRRLVRERPGQLLVEDRVDGKGWHRAESRLHFRPGLRVVINDSYAEVLDENGRSKLAVEFIGAPEVVLVDSEYFPEFGIAQPNAELVLRVAGTLPLSVGYRLIARGRV
jgi:uncharacterized heparinase superfamily protein